MQVLFQQGPAETAAYMVAGFTVIFGVMLLYVISLYLRRRSLERDLEVIHEIQDQDQP